MAKNCMKCKNWCSDAEVLCSIHGWTGCSIKGPNSCDCDDFEPAVESNDGWELVNKIYKHCDKECWYGGGDDIRDGMDYVYKEIMGIIDEYKGKK